MGVSFEFITLFVSVIYGLAVTHALTCMAGYFRRRSSIIHDWLFWMWAFWFFLLSLGFWVSVHSLWHECSDWTFFRFFFVSLQACLFYFTFAMFFNHPDEIENNLKLGFESNKKAVFLLTGALFLLMFIVAPILTDQDSVHQDVRFSGLVLPILFWTFAFVRNRVANGFFAAFMLISFVAQLIGSALETA